MEVKLTIDGEQFAHSFDGLLEKLDEEQVKELTLQIVKNFLGVDPEYSLLRAECVEKAKHSYSYSRRDRDTYDISSEDREKLRKFRSTRQKIIETITEASFKHVHEQVKAWVEEDKLLRDVYEQVKAEVIKEFPSMVMTSVVSWFAGNMNEMIQAAREQYGVYQISERLEHIVQRLQQRWLSDGQPVLESGV